MTRKGYDVELLIDTLKSFRKRYPHLKVVMEPGSAFAWQTGPLVAQIVDVVENFGIRRQFLMLVLLAICQIAWRCHTCR